jgi:hypothetical protein
MISTCGLEVKILIGLTSVEFEPAPFSPHHRQASVLRNSRDQTHSNHSEVVFNGVSDRGEKYTAEFISPEDTTNGRLRIGVEGHRTFWIDSASLMPADNLRGMRPDVVEALRPLRIPILR